MKITELHIYQQDLSALNGPYTNTGNWITANRSRAAATRDRPPPREGAFCAKRSPLPPSVGRLSLNTLALLPALWTGAAQANGTENYNAYYSQPAKVKECTNKATTREDMRGCTRITYETCID